MALSNYLADALLDHTLRNTAYTSPTTVYLALFTTMPDANDSGGTEVTGGSYARQPVTFGAAVDGVAANSAAITFSSMPAATIRGACIYDAVSAGNLLHLGAFAAPTASQSGADFSVPVADVVAVMR